MWRGFSQVHTKLVLLVNTYYIIIIINNNYYYFLTAFNGSYAAKKPNVTSWDYLHVYIHTHMQACMHLHTHIIFLYFQIKLFPNTENAEKKEL